MTGRPNILFIFTDQQRADTLSCYGNTTIQTPNLDSLASGSFVFRNGYITQPICTPARSSIMSGLYPHATGCPKNNIPLDSSVRTIAELAPEEYVKAYYGKWHLGDEVIRQHGFDHWLSMEDQYRQYYTDPEYLSVLSDYHRFLENQGLEPNAEDCGAMTFSREYASRLPEELSRARFLGREAARFIRERSDEPFLMYVNFLEPHPPYHGPLNGMYSPEQAEPGPGFLTPPDDSCSELHLSRSRDFTRDAPADGRDAEMRELIANYMGNVTLMDRAVGDILQALEESGQADNTVVVFTSEHGDQLGEHAILQKAVLYEESVKVPMLIRVPWLNQDQVTVEGRFSHADLVPTLLGLAGAEIPDGLHGRSRLPVLNGSESLAENDVVIEWNGRNSVPHPLGGVEDWAQNTARRCIISAEGWKLILSQADEPSGEPVDRGELYDLNADPHEMSNLFNDGSHAGRIRELAGRIKKWQQATGDTMPLPSV